MLQQNIFLWIHMTLAVTHTQFLCPSVVIRSIGITAWFIMCSDAVAYFNLLVGCPKNWHYHIAVAWCYTHLVNDTNRPYLQIMGFMLRLGTDKKQSKVLKCYLWALRVQIMHFGWTRNTLTGQFSCQPIICGGTSRVHESSIWPCVQLGRSKSAFHSMMLAVHTNISNKTSDPQTGRHISVKHGFTSPHAIRCPSLW